MNNSISPYTTENSEAVVVLTDLCKQYPGLERPAVDAVNMTIKQGEIFGLLGPNGAGKSTTISMMSTALAPSGGGIALMGIDVVRHPARARNFIGLVPQDIALYEEMTGAENLHYFGALFGLQTGTLADRVRECLEFVGLADKAHKPVHTYSGGMKRRLNFAAGIIHRPQILFLDEPTVGIDAQSRNLIFERLEHLHKKGATMIYTTHYMEEAERLCTRVAIIDEGRIIDSGPPEGLIAAADCMDLQELFFKRTGKNLRD